MPPTLTLSPILHAIDAPLQPNAGVLCDAAFPSRVGQFSALLLAVPTQFDAISSASPPLCGIYQLKNGLHEALRP